MRVGVEGVYGDEGAEDAREGDATDTSADAGGAVADGGGRGPGGGVQVEGEDVRQGEEDLRKSVNGCSSSREVPRSENLLTGARRCWTRGLAPVVLDSFSLCSSG